MDPQADSADIDRPTLVVFLKHARPGYVKTRLAVEIGAVAAAEMYRNWIGLVLDVVQPLRPAIKVVGYYDGGSPSDFFPWFDRVDEWWPQPDGDLGHRLSTVFARVAGLAMAIGTDCLEMTSRHIQMAVDGLAEADVVLGPATDGGYYLIAVRRPVAGLFDGVRWSTEFALRDQRAQCTSLGLSVATLPTLSDIDTAADLRRFEIRRSS